MKEFLQFTRGSGTSERRCLNSQCALLGEVSKLGWLLLADGSPFHHHCPMTQVKPPSISAPLCPSFHAKCTSCSPLDRHVSVTSETSVKHVHPDCRHPPRTTKRPSRASLWTWQLQGTFLPWKVYLVISPNVLRWNLLLSKLSWYKPVVGMQ